MSTRISDSTHACLYDSVSMVAFGPVLDSEDEAAAFLDYIAERGEVVGRLLDDELDTLFVAFREESLE